ncbi:transposase domain-containing protein [Streptomyces inhibens]|uniref:transposase domain-containing protein n=1 Tax=Streptomyces inhibens TaxID=2293571 RepID=UPI003CC9CE3B|nr:transposase domain-containing protein [Streptomyces inhibens]
MRWLGRTRREQRRRLLSARLVVYFILGLALFSPAPYLEVLRHLVEGLRGAGLLGSWRIPAKSSLFRVRERLGSEPLRMLFAATAGPLADERTTGAHWHGLRLVAVDGSCWDAADSVANGVDAPHRSDIPPPALPRTALGRLGGGTSGSLRPRRQPRSGAPAAGRPGPRLAPLVTEPVCALLPRPIRRLPRRRWPWLRSRRSLHVSGDWQMNRDS